MKTSLQLVICLICTSFLSCYSPSGDANSASVSGSNSVDTEAVKTVSQPQLSGGTTTKAEYVKTPDYNQLTGDWIRTDGGKTIRIKAANADGRLDAEYFNPKPIHVGRAEWLVKDNNLVVIVELKDVNYPGSRYTLVFYQETEELAGIYYQAVEKSSYEVGFVRQK